MIFRPKLDNGAARGDDEKMQARTKAARALDRALGAAMLWGLSLSLIHISEPTRH